MEGDNRCVNNVLKCFQVVINYCSCGRSQQCSRNKTIFFTDEGNEMLTFLSSCFVLAAIKGGKNPPPLPLQPLSDLHLCLILLLFFHLPDLWLSSFLLSSTLTEAISSLHLISTSGFSHSHPFLQPFYQLPFWIFVASRPMRECPDHQGCMATALQKKTGEDGGEAG